jgi:hypothetical protein
MPLIEFYLNEASNPDGLMIQDIWAMSDEELEFNHDVVQWLFPSIQDSRFNPDAPILTDDEVRLFHSNPRLQENLRTSYHRMMTFFGLHFEDGAVTQVEKKPVWDSFNHNWLRITRILKSLTILGLTTEAVALLTWLKAQETLSSDSMNYWWRAVRK